MAVDGRPVKRRCQMIEGRARGWICATIDQPLRGIELAVPCSQDQREPKELRRRRRAGADQAVVDEDVGVVSELTGASPLMQSMMKLHFALVK